MSLVISLRVPDGIVVAADSLSTAQHLVEIAIEQQNKQIGDKGGNSAIKIPPIPIPFSASSYTQKLFPFYHHCSISVVGLGIINNKSAYYHLKQFERISDENAKLDKIINELVKYMEQELAKQFPNYKNEAPDDWKPIAFHVNGFESDNNVQQAVTYEIFIGKNNIIYRRDQIGCTIGGDMRVVQKLWEIGKQEQKHQIKYGLLTLQDAIDLAEYFINTTSNFQRFTYDIPTVGGEVDIALITPFHGFQWIKRKKLMEILEECDENKQCN